jgi:hypothetical protein
MQQLPPNELFYKLSELLMDFCETLKKSKKKDFTRNRKLPLERLLATILHLCASSSKDGMDIKLNEFFKQSQRSGLWENAFAPHRSALTKARKKLDWTVFEKLLTEINTLANEFFPKRSEYFWNDLSVYAFDGSKFNLPATPEIRAFFDAKSGLENKGKGHYPQALVNTVYDVFRRMPVGRTVMPIDGGNEREEAKKLLKFLPEWCVCLFDRGYPSYDFVAELLLQPLYFVMRCPATSTFSAVKDFIASKKQSDSIYLIPSSGQFAKKLSKKKQRALKAIPLRIILLNHPDGTTSILLTNLPEKKEFSDAEIINLYYRRWAIENHYRDEKYSFLVENFHSKSVDGIQQELFAILINVVLARLVTALSVESESIETKKCLVMPQLKNAVKSLAQDISVFVSRNLEKAIVIFRELLDQIRAVKYYKSKIPKSSKPRVNKASANKWQVKRKSKIVAACA